MPLIPNNDPGDLKRYLVPKRNFTVLPFTDLD